MDSDPGSPGRPPDPYRSPHGGEIFRRLVEHSLGLMCIHDLDGNLLFVNAAAAESLGFSPEQGIGSNLRRFLAPSVQGEFSAYLQRIREHGKDSGLMRLVARDGGERIWMYRNVLHEEPGMPPRVLGHAIDATDRVRAERALRESERRFRALADTAPVLIWMADPDGRSVFLNRAWLDFTGRPPDEHLDEGWIESLHPSDRDRFTEACREAIVGRREFQMECRLRRADGEHRWMVVSGVPRPDIEGAPAGLVGSCLDITEIRQARELLEHARDELSELVAERTAELRERNEQLRAEMERRVRIEEELARTRRIESLGVLAGGLAHEFDNLLSVIIGRSHSLFERFQDQEPARRDLDAIQRAAQRAATLIQQLLAFARKQPLRPQPLNLNQLLVGLSLGSVVPVRVELSLRLAEDLRPTSVDPGQMQRAALHLVENACDGMPEGGQLILETANVDLDEAYAEAHPGARSGPHVRLTVRDTGMGMDEDARRRAFEPFFNAGRGPESGHLGLAAVYGITKQHGGYITVESEPGFGSAFTLYLPAVAGAGARAGEAADRGAKGREGAETIFLVEEEEAVRLLLRDILQLHGYHVLEGGDPQEALALAGRWTGAIHLLLTDVSMTKMSGPALADRFVRACPGVKVLYMSGYAADALERQGVLSAGAALLEKPFTMMTLLGKVRAVLDG
jgi:PAS domain S-box-containing protein